MARELKSLRFELTSKGPDRLQWAEMRLHLADSEQNVVNEVRVAVPVDIEGDTTFAAMRNKAVGQIVDILEAALIMLREVGPEELIAMEHRREAEEAKAIDEQKTELYSRLNLDLSGPATGQ